MLQYLPNKFIPFAIIMYMISSKSDMFMKISLTEDLEFGKFSLVKV